MVDRIELNCLCIHDDDVLYTKCVIVSIKEPAGDEKGFETNVQVCKTLLFFVCEKESSSQFEMSQKQCSKLYKRLQQTMSTSYIDAQRRRRLATASCWYTYILGCAYVRCIEHST